MSQLEYLLFEFNFPNRQEDSQTDIAEIEKHISFALPDDYKFYLNNYQGHEQMMWPEYVRIFDIDELLDCNTGYKIFQTLPFTLGIGSNGSGEFIALEFVDNKDYRVVLSPFIELDKQYHIEIGSSFTNFFDRLYNAKEWFK